MKFRQVYGLKLENTPTGLQISDGVTRFDADVLADPALADVVSRCDDWLDEASLKAVASERFGERGDHVVDTLISSGWLVSDADPHTNAASAVEQRWTASGWAAPLAYHVVQSRMPRLDYATDGFKKDVAGMREHAAAEPIPAIYKDVDGPMIGLPELSELDPSCIVLRRATVGDAMVATQADGGRPWTKEQLSWFLKLAYGQTTTNHQPVTKRHVGKTSPSGGSRHPTEVYVVVLDVADVPPGLYHYSVRRHGLVLLRAGDHHAFVADALAYSKCIPGFPVHFAIIYATIPLRSMFRYREPFSYRVLSHDIGHLAETSRLLCSALGRPISTHPGIADSVVDTFLGVDGMIEAAMAATLVG